MCYMAERLEDMKISDVGLSIIKLFEGCRLEAYKDAAGVWTIGYGHTKGVTKGQKITQAQADTFLKQDCASAERNVSKFDNKYHWNQNQFDAMVSFAYNVGSINGLTANGTRSIQQISNKITAYNKAGGKILRGLRRRRAAEKKLFDTPVVEARPVCESAVRSLKEALNADGIKDAKGMRLKVNGSIDDSLEAALKKVVLKAGKFDAYKARYAVGSKGQTVKWLEMRLDSLIGDSIKELVGHTLTGGKDPDGLFGNDVWLAVGLFQEMQGLDPDHVAGRNTIRALLYT